MNSDAISARTIAKVALPGVSKEELKVEIHDTHLTISAKHNAEAEKTREAGYCRDGRDGEFFRSILLPDGVDANQIRAIFANGVLEVSVPEADGGIKRRKRDGHDGPVRRSRTWRPPMVEIRTILCPVDFSEPSRHAFEYAVGLATWYGASVSVLHVHHVGILTPTVDSLVVPGIVEPIVLTSDHTNTASRRLHKFIAAGHAENAKIESLVEDGLDVLAAILSRAEAISADLIALGTNGRSSGQEPTLGSVAEDVLRGAASPVLCVPSSSTDSLPRGPVSFRRIVCPIDFSESSRRALGYAVGLARDANAFLTVVHVVDLSSETADLLPDFHEHREARLEPARRSLRASVAEAVHESLFPEEVLQIGSPHDEILHLAHEQQAGLLVTGLGGKSGDGQNRLGATIRAVVPRSRCPVLAVP